MKERGHNSGTMWGICRVGTGERTRESPVWKRLASLSPVGFRHFWLEHRKSSDFRDVRQEGGAYGKPAISSGFLYSPYIAFCLSK